MPKLLCQAIVDEVWVPEGLLKKIYKVTVTGREPFNYVKIYTITAISSDMAAEEGMNLFDRDVALLPPVDMRG